MPGDLIRKVGLARIAPSHLGLPKTCMDWKLPAAAGRQIQIPTLLTINWHAMTKHTVCCSSKLSPLSRCGQKHITWELQMECLQRDEVISICKYLPVHHVLDYKSSEVDNNTQLWLVGNSNRKVDEEKPVQTGSPFKSDYTPTKMNNEKLRRIYAELENTQILIRSSKGEAQRKALKLQENLLTEAKSIQELIKTSKGMPIPIPNHLGKKQKSKVALFK